LSEDSSVLDAAMHWKVRHRKGQLIYDEGEPARAMYRLDQGCVRLQVIGPEGDRQIVAFLFPGDHFGVCVDTRTSSAEAVTDVELTRYALQSVLDLSGRSTEVTVRLMKTAETLYGDLAHHVEQIAHLNAPDRLLWFLHRLMQHAHLQKMETIKLPMSRRDIADYLGLSQETLSRVTRQLQQAGYIEARGPRSFILRRLDLPGRATASDQGVKSAA
jgi:CRP-like cAMP-binding protein